MLLNRLLLFITGYFVGSLLMSMNLPIPFMMGGMITAIACKACARKIPISWPRKWREYALTVAGYGIGANFTPEAWNNLFNQSLGVVEATGSILLASVICSYITAKVTHFDHKSCLMGMFPGGLTVMMLMADEDKDVNPNVVAVMQVLRMLMVVTAVPFLTIYLLHAKVVNSGLAASSSGGTHWLIFIPLAILGVFISKKLHFPTPTLLGPILTTAIYAIYVGPVQPVPHMVMNPAQLCIGLYMGMQLDVEHLAETKITVPFIIVSTMIMIGVSVGMANVLSGRYGFSLITAFLAMAPGGIAEMSLAGLSMGENVSVILTYQLVRMLTMNMLIPPTIKYVFREKQAA